MERLSALTGRTKCKRPSLVGPAGSARQALAAVWSHPATLPYIASLLDLAFRRVSTTSWYTLAYLGYSTSEAPLHKPGVAGQGFWRRFVWTLYVQITYKLAITHKMIQGADQGNLD